MALLGTNNEAIKTSLSGIDSAYKAVITELKDNMQTKFVDEMATKWACHEAQEFFGKFKEVVDGLLKDTYTTFDSIIDSINSAGKAWATEQGDSSVWTDHNFSAQGAETISVDCIKENLNGDRGIDDGAKTFTLTTLDRIYINADNALESARTSVNSTGFLGGDQETTLQSSIKSIRDNLSKTIQTLKTDAVNAIDATVEKYKQVGTKVTNAFSGSSEQ